MQSDWCPYKKRKFRQTGRGTGVLAHRRTIVWRHDQMQAKEKGLRRKQTGHKTSFLTSWRRQEEQKKSRPWQGPQKKLLVIDKLEAIRYETVGTSPEETVHSLENKIWSWGQKTDPRLFLNWHLRVTCFTYLVENLQIRILVLVTDLLFITVS